MLLTDRCLRTLCVFLTLLQVNNAGVNFNKGPDNSVEFAEQVIETNYYGTKRMIDAMIPLMKPSSYGARIVNVSSRLGRVNGRRNVSMLDRFLYIANVILCDL